MAFTLPSTMAILPTVIFLRVKSLLVLQETKSTIRNALLRLAKFSISAEVYCGCSILFGAAENHKFRRQRIEAHSRLFAARQMPTFWPNSRSKLRVFELIRTISREHELETV